MEHRGDRRPCPRIRSPHPPTERAVPRVVLTTASWDCSACLSIDEAQMSTDLFAYFAYSIPETLPHLLGTLHHFVGI